MALKRFVHIRIDLGNLKAIVASSCLKVKIKWISKYVGFLSATSRSSLCPLGIQWIGVPQWD